MSGGVHTETELPAGAAGAAHEPRFEPSAGLRGADRGAATSAMRRDQLFRRSLFAADLVAFGLALITLSLLASRSLRLTWVGFGGVLAILVGGKIAGLYDRDASLLHKTTLDEAPLLLHVATLGALCAWLVGGLLVAGGSLTRAQVLLLWALLLIFLVLSRWAARNLALAIAPPERCLFIGDRQAATMIRSKLGGNHGTKAEVVADIDLGDHSAWAAWSTDACSTARVDEIRDLASSLDVQRAIIAPDRLEPERMLDLVCTLEAVGVKVSMLPRLLEVVGSSIEFDDLHGVTVMGIKGFVLSRSSATVKRAFDLVGACLGLLALAPVLIAFAIAIKLDSPGPVFFRQRRVGRHGEHFGLFKFRTMVEGADAMKDSLRDRNEAQEGLFKIADDPRVTRVGRLLRKTSLDELPQLFNVVLGEMSLVGPRPLVIDEDCHVTGWYRRRLELMPGMTGPWQILGPARVPLREMGAIDYLYVANWSLWGDVKILLRTVRHVLARRGL